jgi:hypothetical protein
MDRQAGSLLSVNFLAAMRFPPITSDFSWVRTSTAMVYLINHPRVPAGFTRVRVGQYGPPFP